MTILNSLNATGLPKISKIAAALMLVAAALTAGGADRADAQERTKVRLVYHPALLPAYAKERTELFAEPLAAKGIDIEWVDVQGTHAPAIAAVLGGTADVTFGGTTSVALSSAANGQDIRIAALGKSVVTNGGIVAYPGSGIDSVEDLRGKTVAVNRGGFGELTLVSALRKHNIPRSEVEFVFLSIADGAAAFAAKQVDAYVALSSGVQTVTIDYGAKLIFDVDKDLTREEAIIAGNTISFVTRGDFAQANKKALFEVFTAYKRVADWVIANKDAAFEISDRVNKYPASIKEAVREKFRGYELNFPHTEKDIDLQQQSADFLVETKVLPRKIDVTDYIVKY